MCNFLSAIVTRSGTVLAAPEYTDSHSELIEHFGLRETEAPAGAQQFAKVEFTPPDNRFDEPEKYILKIDEETTPAWFDHELKGKIEIELRRRVTAMILRDVEKGLLLRGCWILTGKAKIHKTKNVRIHSMWGSSNVGVMWESSNVGAMWESSKVGMMRGSSNVGAMRASSNVGENHSDAVEVKP